MRLSRRGPRPVASGVDSFSRTIERAKDGDDSALSSLYRDHVAMVFGYLRACRVGDAEDLTSEVFVGMLRNLDRFDGSRPEFRRWLMTIAHRRLVDHQRRHGRNRTEPTEPATLETAGSNGTVIDLHPLELSPDLIAAFGRLSDAQREVLALRFVADVSLKDVSDIVGRPVAAVKSLQNRGLSSLRRQIRDPRVGEEVPAP